jgi:hypothetical protein
MSDIADKITAPPKAIAGWAKARPVVFGILIFATIVVAIRYRNRVVSFFTGLPVVGEWIGKLMGLAPAAAVLLSLCFASDAQAADLAGSATGHYIGYALGAAVVLGLLLLRLIRGDAGPAFSVYFPREDSLDLRTPDGSFSVTMTPGAAEQPAQFKITGDKGTFGGGWLKATGITKCLTTVFDQAASGGSAVFWDELPRVIGGFEMLHPLWGTMLTKETGSGPILKHLIEFIGHGGQYAGDDARAVIAAADGDTTCDLYVTYPFAQRCMVRPTDQMPWVGWLDQTLLNFYLAPSTAIAAVSTGAVIKATTSLRMGLDYVLDNDLEIPTLSYWQRYTHNAGSETIRALGLGSAGPKGTKGVERLVGIYELFNVWGFGGCTTADNITAVFLEQLGLSRVTNVDMLVKNYLKTLGGVRSPKGGNGASALHAMAGNPYTMGATPSNRLNASTLAYLPLRAPGRDQEITKVPKFAGDLVVTQTYTSTPSSGQHILVVQSIREFTTEMARELAARANRSGAKVRVPLADGSTEQMALATRTPSGLQGLPRKVG